MNLIFKSSTMQMYVCYEQSLLLSVWTEKSRDCSLEEFRVFAQMWRETVIQFQLRFALHDTRKFFFCLNPAMQDWASQEIFRPAFQANLEKNAFLTSEDLIADLSLEQQTEENKQWAPASANAYFGSMEQAQHWLGVKVRL
ncbi:MAG: hypothetical protein OHK0053_34980 [Microscillaceae bacterium]